VRPLNRPTSTRADRLSRQGALNRWGLAAALDAHLPQLRGRDRLLGVVRGTAPPKPLQSETLVRWGPCLEAIINPSLDGSLQALYAAQWVRPSLVAILEACLEPGHLFVDVGANVGIYSTWAARIVGAGGSVLALEPLSPPRIWLEEICAYNALRNVEVLPIAAGAYDGFARMQTMEGASGRSRVVATANTNLEVPITTLDNLFGSRTPTLIKIDVEGHELSVLQGASRTLHDAQVPVVFEAPDYGGGSGTLECVRLLESLNYRVFSLTPRGTRTFSPTGYSHNLLALHITDSTLARRLQRVRFPRNQNV
jgi:FkbM family methyltransferase